MGGRLGNVFDEDPKRWRMVAEAFLTVGLALEIATAFSPGNFIMLAGAGNLSRAVGRGMTNPCFRIIQTHFAAASNIGDVAAKEEVIAFSLDNRILSCTASHSLLNLQLSDARLLLHATSAPCLGTPQPFGRYHPSLAEGVALRYMQYWHCMQYWQHSRQRRGAACIYRH